MSRVYTFAEVLDAANKARRAGKRIVATNGCFDILHIGHVRNLASAKRLGDVLIVGINSDRSVRMSKGLSRPIIPARERAEILASLKSVDYVFIFGERTPFYWIKKLQPHIHVKGGTLDVKKHPDFVEHERVVKSYGGTLLLVKPSKGKSTSNIIKKIRGQ